VTDLNVAKGHIFFYILLLDKSMTFGTDDLDVILYQNFYGSNLKLLFFHYSLAIFKTAVIQNRKLVFPYLRNYFP